MVLTAKNAVYHLLLKEKREGKKDMKKGLREEKEKENARQGRSRKLCMEKTGIGISIAGSCHQCIHVRSAVRQCASLELVWGWSGTVLNER